MGKLEGKVAIVTGAGRGIGRGIALAFAKEDAKVVVASRTRETVDSVTQEILTLRKQALGMICDVGERPQIEAMVARTVAEFGTVDILVNNAQSYSVHRSYLSHIPLEDFPEDDWEHTFRTGLLATLWCSQAVFPYMKDRGGKIINFGSVLGLTGGEGTAAYSSTKEAIKALSKTAAREWGRHKITVNLINPSIWTDTAVAWAREYPDVASATLRNIPMSDLGDAERDVGRAAVFLASEDANFITGVTLWVDGGAVLSGGPPGD